MKLLKLIVLCLCFPVIAVIGAIIGIAHAAWDILFNRSGGSRIITPRFDKDTAELRTWDMDIRDAADHTRVHAGDTLLIEDSEDGAKRHVMLQTLRESLGQPGETTEQFAARMGFGSNEEARDNGYVNIGSAYGVATGLMDSDYSGPSRGGTEPAEPQVQQMPKAGEPRRKLDRKLKEGD